MKRMLQKWLVSSAEDRCLAIRSLFALPRLSFLLRNSGFSCQHARPGELPLVIRSLAPPEEQILHARAAADIVNGVAARLPFQAKCLVRSVYLRRTLAERGIVTSLKIGVRIERLTLDAHAWVECYGTPINDSANVTDRFADMEAAPSYEISAFK